MVAFFIVTVIALAALWRCYRQWVEIGDLQSTLDAAARERQRLIELMDAMEFNRNAADEPWHPREWGRSRN